MATNNFLTETYIEKLIRKLKGEELFDPVHTVDTPLDFESLASLEAAWFKVKGMPNVINGEIPDDSPSNKNVYIGPFIIYDTDL